MTFRRSAEGKVLISEQALRAMVSHRQVGRRAMEGGGVLLGRMILSCDDVVIDDVTTPSSADKRRRFFFWRSPRPAQRRVVEAWRESDHTVNYLGEWHTHPEEAPHPSSRDRSDWLRILGRARFEQDYLFFLIVGTEQIRAWEGSREAGQISLLLPL